MPRILLQKNLQRTNRQEQNDAEDVSCDRQLLDALQKLKKNDILTVRITEHQRRGDITTEAL